MYIKCKHKDVQSLQSSYFLVFYHFGFETTTLTFSRIIDFDDATNLFFKRVFSCAVVDPCLLWIDLIILISRPVRWEKLYQSTHFKGKLHKLQINLFTSGGQDIYVIPICYSGLLLQKGWTIQCRNNPTYLQHVVHSREIY